MEKQTHFLEDIQNKLETGIKEIMCDEKFQEWLKFVAGFHQYSYKNSVLIFTQNPKATLVKGYKGWKQFGRHVKKGEKAIKILVPLFKKKTEKESVFPNQKDEKELYGFRYANVFDISQTDGKELPESPAELLKSGGEKEVSLLHEWIEKIEVPVCFEDTGEANGYFNREKNLIAIHQDRDPLHQLKTLIHEYAHYLLHAKGAVFHKENRNIKEAQAESVAYVVMNYFGYDTGSYSFAYISSWSGDIEIMQKIGIGIVECSQKVINRLEKNEEHKMSLASN